VDIRVKPFHGANKLQEAVRGQHLLWHKDVTPIFDDYNNMWFVAVSLPDVTDAPLYVRLLLAMFC
jgi:hypothetical protein